MVKASQQCRVCKVEIPAGFTNCDTCYYQSYSLIRLKTLGPMNQLPQSPAAAQKELNPAFSR